MINRTKLSVIAVSAVLAVALTGCGGSASSAPSSVSSASASAPVSDAASPAADTTENGTADLDSAVESLLAANPISNQFEIAAVDPVGYLLLGLKCVVFPIHPTVCAVELGLLLLQFGLPAFGIQDPGTVVLETGACLRLDLVEAPFRILDLEIDCLELLVQHAV